MALAFGTTGAQTGTATPLAVTIAVNNGDTVIVTVTFNPNTCAVTSITGGGAFTLRTSVNNGANLRQEMWSTDAGAGVSASSVSVAFSGTAADAGAMVETVTGVLGLGPTATATGSTLNPTIAIVTQDSNNWVVAGFGWGNTGATTLGGDIRATDGNISISDAIGDHTVAAPGTCTVSAIHGAVTWVATAIELRTVAGGGSTRPWPATRGLPFQGPRDARGFLRQQPWNAMMVPASTPSTVTYPMLERRERGVNRGTS